MTTSSNRSRRVPGQPLGSPLAAPSGPGGTLAQLESFTASPRPGRLSDRGATRAEFEDYLRTTNNKYGRPYEEATISAYVAPVKTLDDWMTVQGIDGDFTVADTAMLNKFFREYYQEHRQGGTHTLQRNLIQLFNYLSREYGHPSPYASGLNRYAEVKGRPKTLDGDFIGALLEGTGGGSARDFEAARDHAIIRILCGEGVRRSEVLDMVMHTMPADLTRNPVFRVVPLKGARASGEGRLVSLGPSAARALAVYLRARRHHRLADSDWVWLGTRGRGRFANTGIRKMLGRRAEQAGYSGVTPHQFRHTFSDAWLKSGGSEGDLMRQAIGDNVNFLLLPGRHHDCPPGEAVSELQDMVGQRVERFRTLAAEAERISGASACPEGNVRARTGSWRRTRHACKARQLRLEPRQRPVQRPLGGLPGHGELAEAAGYPTAQLEFLDRPGEPESGNIAEQRLEGHLQFKPGQA
jgi:site-specific recombinase XerD